MRHLITLTISIAAFGSASAVAADKTFDFGPFEVAPSTQVQFKHDDNIFRSNTDEQDSSIIVVKPRLEATVQNGGSKYMLFGEIENGTYNDSSDDNYTDFAVGGEAHVEFNRRNFLDLTVAFLDEHEDRGTGYSQGTQVQGIDEPDEYEDTLLDAKYTFGGVESKGRLELAAKVLDKNFTNNKPESDLRDRSEKTLGATFYWQVMPKTSILIEGRKRDIGYDNDLNNPDLTTLDSDETDLFLGVEWVATAQTTGKIKFGKGEREFDDSRADTFDESRWEAAIEWRPRAQTLLTFGTKRSGEETRGSGTFIDRKEYQVAWIKQWTYKIRSEASAYIAEDAYEGITRDDDISLYRLGIIYAQRPWLSWELSFTADERDSDQLDLDYDRNVVQLGLNFNM